MSYSAIGGSTSSETKTGDDEEKEALQAELAVLRASVEKSQVEKQELTLKISQLEQSSGETEIERAAIME